MPRGFGRGLVVMGLLLAADPPGAPPQASSPASLPLPARLERHLAATVRPTAADRRRLLAGGPLVTLLDAEASREIAVFGAIWINASAEQYVQAIKDIERFENGRAFPRTKRISSPPTLEDFARMELPAEDVRGLEDCRPGDCDLQLGQAAIEALRSGVDFSGPGAKPAAEAVFRQRALEYVRQYLDRGNAGLASYRDQPRPTSVATEFAAIVDHMPELDHFHPGLRRYLLHYPGATLPDSTDFLYWQETRFGLKPTIRISHLVVHQGPTETVVATKMLYASHYFWTALDLRLLTPDPARGKGFWFITTTRSRSGSMTGFLRALLRGRVRNEARQSVLAVLTHTKTKLEASAVQ